MKRGHDLSLAQVYNFLACYIEFLNVRIINKEMKKILFLLIACMVLLVLFLMLASSQQDDDPNSWIPDTVKDIDGNIYHTVTIGHVVWMVENLRTTRLKNGTAIPLVTDSFAWISLKSPGYCWYDNNQALYRETYGALYNWYAVNSGKICPKGWHVPTENDWYSIACYIAEEDLIGGKLKEKGTAHWISPNEGATNEFGFTVLPGGFRGSAFEGLGLCTFLWSAVENDAMKSYCTGFTFNSSKLYTAEIAKSTGVYIRCVMDEYLEDGGPDKQ